LSFSLFILASAIAELIPVYLFYLSAACLFLKASYIANYGSTSLASSSATGSFLSFFFFFLRFLSPVAASEAVLDGFYLSSCFLVSSFYEGTPISPNNKSNSSNSFFF
jgi:hypothetical protein